MILEWWVFLVSEVPLCFYPELLREGVKGLGYSGFRVEDIRCSGWIDAGF